MLTYSGGKDSTAAICVALEVARNRGGVKRIDVIYCDSMLEIASIRIQAHRFIASLQAMQSLHSLPLNVAIIKPKVEDRYWVRMLGYGYPPPHQRFRWCTTRLKIVPVAEALADVITPGKSVILTGVRFGESKSRERALHEACNKGGECGQGLWFIQKHRKGAAYLAPIVEWRTCDVWDYLNLIAPALGYNTGQLELTYGTRDIRFGCWTCTVVRQERALAATVKRPEFKHLEPLVQFRRRIWDETRPIESRELRQDGRAGRLTLETRQALMAELLDAEDQTGVRLIEPEEVTRIRAVWAQEPRLSKL
ncbi:MAG TPA: phosphoadenosine phosphosulfate reductase family protein [Nitrospira sp.]|nr:phosphoadenosine phosphosulfate reductase family protein [Nitrospira sp.]